MSADTDQLVLDLGSLLTHDVKISAHSWENLVIVAQFRSLSIKVNGFAYTSTGESIPTSPRGVDVTKKFQELRDAMKEPGKDQWKAAIVRMERSSNSLNIDFEYDDPDKWLINPSTVERMAQVLRPTAKA